MALTKFLLAYNKFVFVAKYFSRIIKIMCCPTPGTANLWHSTEYFRHSIDLDSNQNTEKLYKMH